MNNPEDWDVWKYLMIYPELKIRNTGYKLWFS